LLVVAPGTREDLLGLTGELPSGGDPMGRVVKQVSEGTTRYYWYPGDKKDWVRAGVAFAVGAGACLVVGATTRSGLIAVVGGTSATAAVAGVNFGRRDARALAGFPELGDRAARRAAVAHTGRALWRAFAEVVGGAAAAVLIVNMPAHGFLANWALPLVPPFVGAMAHQGGMLWERLARSSRPASQAVKVPGGIPAVGMR
jgi:hypothetical protein